MWKGQTTGPPQGRWHPARMVSSGYVLASTPPPTSTAEVRVYCVLRMLGIPRRNRTAYPLTLARLRLGFRGRAERSNMEVTCGRYSFSCPRCRFLDGCSRECWIVSAGYRRRQAEGGYNHDLAKREERSRESPCLQCGFTPLAGGTPCRVDMGNVG